LRTAPEDGLTTAIAEGVVLVSSPLRAAALVVIGMLALSACQPSASESPGGSEPPAGSGAPSGDALSGDVQVSGSSTVLPISNLVFEAFTGTHPDVTGFVDGPGTGDGFALFCNEEVDIADASRAISDEEAAACADAGVEFVELKIAIDGIAVITSAENSAVECLSFLDLYALIGPESQGFSTWSDASDLASELAGELGAEFGESHAPYPNETLTITAPGDESGTFDSFVDLALGDIAEARGQDATTRPDYQASPDDNVIIEGVAGSADAPFTLGWVGFAYAAENTDRVTMIPVDGGDGCTAADAETISAAEYPISRFLYIYPNVAHADANPALQAFVDFFLSDDGLAFVSEAGYVQLHEDDLAASREAWDGR
jgi:phosphate transport system substrate-binding protein